MIKVVTTGLFAACCMVSAVAAEEVTLPGEDDMVFDYRPSANIAMAEMGGAVKAEIKGTNITYDDAGKSLLCKNPGNGFLRFPSAGNLPGTAGTVIADVAYNMDVPAIIDKLRQEKKWSKPYFVFSSFKDGQGIGLFLDVMAKMRKDQIVLTCMISKDMHKWQYVSGTLNVKDFSPNKRFQVGYSWSNEHFALLVNGKVIAQRKLDKRVPSTPFFTIGGSGDSAFQGNIFGIKIFQKATVNASAAN